MQTETKQSSFARGHMPEVQGALLSYTLYRAVEFGSGVSAYRNGSTIGQAARVSLLNQTPLHNQHPTYLLSNHAKSTPPLVELPCSEQAREHIEMVLSHETQCLVLVTPKEGVSDQGHCDNLAVGETRLWTSTPPPTKMLLQCDMSIIHKYEPNGEYVFPAVTCDKIGKPGHCVCSFVCDYSRSSTLTGFIQPFITPN
jgi:hypothetical protein